MKVCICGTVKNVGKYLQNVFKNMEKIASLFEEYIIILYYDKSEDDTLQQLKKYQENNTNFYFYVNTFPLSKYRTHNISKGRNICLNKIREKYTNYEYFIMMDCDDVCSGNINLDVLEKNLQNNEWDALSFNRKNYYDIWALSIKPYVVSMRHFHNMVSVEKTMKRYVTKLLDKIPKNKLLPCYSAFNGFSIYKTNVFIRCSYDGKLRLDLIPKKKISINQLALNDKIKLIYDSNAEDNINQDCEHRSFHLQAIQKFKAKIFISPDILFD